MKSIAVIGAGIAGLACARDLRRAGHAVQVFDKGRSPGGRASSRRRGATDFDHGVPWFTAASPAFRADLEAALRSGAVRPVRPRLVALGWGPARRLPDVPWTYAGWPNTRRYAHHLAADVPVRANWRVTALRRRARALDDDGWEVQAGPHVAPLLFDAVVLALPAPQAPALLPGGHPWRQALAEVAMAPVLTALAAPSSPLAPDWDAATVAGSPLARAVCRRPAGPSPPLADRPAPEAWVLHAASDWSRRHLEQDPERSARALWGELATVLGRASAPPARLRGHRWRHALTVRPLGLDCLHDPDAGLGVCGDWCRGDRLEDAWTSGRALAARLVQHLGKGSPARADAAFGLVH